MRWPQAISAALFFLGAALISYSLTLPYYSDPEAPGRLADELRDALRETRFREWYARLADLETPRKQLSDWGRGLLAAGAAVLFSAAICRFGRFLPKPAAPWMLLALWVGLWLVRVPLSYWYYQRRAERFDYPPWGDSVAIAIVDEEGLWILGALVSSPVLLLFLAGRRLPDSLRFMKPARASGWIRSALLACWLAALLWCVVFGIPDGDEGQVFSCGVAAFVVLLLLGARRHTNFAQPLSGP